MTTNKQLTESERYLVDSLFAYFCVSGIRPVYEGTCEDCGLDSVQYEVLGRNYSCCLSQLGIKTLKNIILAEEIKRIEKLFEVGVESQMRAYNLLWAFAHNII